VARYLADGNAPDFSGAFLEWLVPRQPVYGYRFPGDWRDIGDAEQLQDADNHLRELAGLPLRNSYSLG
jgi:glucose-1-phosphate thymidylyltransferase